MTQLFEPARPEAEQQALRELMRQRLHPITCRICRQELAYFRDVGRFPMEESEVQVAYRDGCGYRSLLTVWWGRVVDHLSGELREMPAVSSYYRHMSFHLGVRTEREPSPPAVPTSPALLATPPGIAPPAGPVAPAPVAAPTAFPTVISVPVPPQIEGSIAPSVSSPPRAEPAQVHRSLMRMTRTMAELSSPAASAMPSARRGAGARAPGAPPLFQNAAPSPVSHGGYAMHGDIAPTWRRRRA